MRCVLGALFSYSIKYGFFCFQEYTYHVKIIRSRKQQLVREVQRFHGKFTSVVNLRVKPIEEFVPSNISFSVGYFGQHNKKLSLSTTEDLGSMYASYSNDQFVV